MVKKATRKNSMLFCLQPENNARRVMLAGDFNGWIPAEMLKSKSGLYSTEVALSSGPHQYKFVVDGKWISDPDQNNRVTNSFGTINSVVTV